MPRPVDGPLKAVDGLLNLFGRRQEEACRRFVAEGVERETIWTGLHQQIY